jgi:hypothetical protein
MKQRLKQITKFIAICALVVLSSCEKDLYEEGIKQNNNLKIEQKSFQELLLNKKFNTAYEKVEKSKISKKGDLQGRTALEDEYNFTIVEQSPVKILTNESDGSVTYVMLIERPISENLKFENLILYDKNGILDGRIIKYTLSKEPEKDENHGGEILDIQNTEMTTLEIDGRIGIPCVMTYTIMCGTLGTTPYNNYTGVHIANWECYTLSDDLFMVTSLECSGGGNIEGSSSIGNNGSSNGSGNTGPNGGGVAGTTPSIPTSPISPFGSNETIIDDPCTSLKNLLDPTKCNARDKIVQVKNESSGYNGEVGATFSNNNGVYSSSPIKYSPASNTNSSSDAVQLDYDENTYAAAHSHPDNVLTTPMYSFSDLLELYRIYTNTNPVNIPNVTFILTLPTTGATYAIKVDNIQVFRDFIQSIYSHGDVEKIPFNKPKLRVNKRNDIFQKMMCQNCNPGNGPNSSTDYSYKFIDGFLQTTKGKGLSMYKATNNTTNWEKLDAAENDSQYPCKTTPCN